MAQRRLARASNLTRSAPAALCLRRRSQSHRWSSADKAFRRECQLRPHCVEADHTRVRAAAIASVRSSSFHPSIDIHSTAAVPGSALAAHCDQQSSSLLASSTNAIVSNHLFALYGSCFRGWEYHGKSDRQRNAGIPARCLHSGSRPSFSGSRGVGGDSVARPIIDLPHPYTAALANILPCRFVSQCIGRQS